MTIAVLANDDQWQEINTGIEQVYYFRIKSVENIPADVEAYLFLQDDLKIDFNLISKPVLINSVCFTLKEMNAPANVIRINGWTSFLSRSTWEISGSINESALEVFSLLGKQVMGLPDEPGFISARIIAMLINEAYFALEDKVSTRSAIDTAMKLGTNYPYGPFEWASLIGVDKIYTLLQKLSLHDSRYLPATSLKDAATI